MSSTPSENALSGNKREAALPESGAPAKKPKERSYSDVVDEVKKAFPDEGFFEAIAGEASRRMIAKESCLHARGLVPYFDEVTGDAAFVARLPETVAARRAEKEAEEAARAAALKKQEEEQGWSGAPTVEKLTALGERDPARLEELCKVNGVLTGGTAKEQAT